MNRKCSHCGQNGHNLRTCGDKGLKLFGVRILSEEDSQEMMRKSASMGNLSAAGDNAPSGGHGYLSDCPVGRQKLDRKRGVPWTEEEHRTFLAGLEMLGKGDWRGISRNFVITRTPTQVASHAQKYFLRQTMSNKKKRRSSLFDMTSMPGTTPTTTMMRANEVPEEIPLCHDDNSLIGTASINENQDSIQHSEASPMTPSSGACQVLDFSSMNYMNGYVVEIQTADPTSNIPPPLSAISSHDCSNLSNVIPPKFNDNTMCTPEFLRLSLNPSPTSTPHCPPQSTADTPAECNDLELSIAPPRPLNSTKLPSGTSNLSGAIQVI